MATAGITSQTSRDAWKTNPTARGERAARSVADCRADLDLMLEPLRNAALATFSGALADDLERGGLPPTVTAQLELNLITDHHDSLAEQAAEELIQALEGLAKHSPQAREWIGTWMRAAADRF